MNIEARIQSELIKAGPATFQQLASRMDLHEASVRRAGKNLERRGLIFFSHFADERALDKVWAAR